LGTGIDGWQPLDSGDGGFVAVDPTDTSILYAEGTDLSIRKSTDGGMTFVDAITGISDSGFLFIAPLVMSPNDPRIPWTGGSSVWRTTNRAASWMAASPVLGCGSVSAIAVAPRAGLRDDTLVDQVVLAGTSGGCVFRTRTALAGGGWTPVSVDGSGFV